MSKRVIQFIEGDRVDQCVQACSGMADPAAAISVAHELASVLANHGPGNITNMTWAALKACELLRLLGGSDE